MARFLRRLAEALVVPATPEEMARAKKVDLVTLPENVQGTNCGNCKFQKDAFCTHPEVNQKVSPRMCCALWDAEGVFRPWEKKETEVDAPPIEEKP